MRESDKMLRGLAERLDALQTARAEKFGELCRMLSFRLSLGELDALSHRARTELELEAEGLIETWDMAENSEVNVYGRALAIDSPLQKLLSEIQEISEQVLDDCDLATQKRDTSE